MVQYIFFYLRNRRRGKHLDMNDRLMCERARSLLVPLNIYKSIYITLEKKSLKLRNNNDNASLFLPPCIIVLQRSC